MNKFKKLLSVLLAAVMLVSCFSVLGSAYTYTVTEIGDDSEYYFDSNDNPRVYLYTAEQRATIAMNTVDELLGSLNIKMLVNIYVSKILVDLTSYDALCDTLDNGTISTALNLGGDLADLEHSAVDGRTRDNGGDVAALNSLMQLLDDNETLFYELINGGIDLGTIGSLGNIDLSGVNEIIADIPGLLGGIIYGLDDRHMTNGIGEDPTLPDDVAWDDLTDKPTIDAMLPELISNVLTNPRNTIRITERSQNTLGDQALEEVDEWGNTYYYCYGVETAEDGTQTLITDPEADGATDKQYLTRWDENSALLKGEAADDFKALFSLDKDLYTLLEDMLGWAYDNFAGHNLDAQLRATLMQFCGAYNNGDVDEDTKAQLKEIMDGYRALEEEGNFDKEILQKQFLAEEGRAGNYNFMYISLSGANINDKPDDLYYVVEWDGGYQYYHVEYTNLSTFFDLIDWEYQAPTWTELTTEIGWTSGTSLLQYINNIAGTILTTAVNRTVETDVTYWTDADKTATTTATETLSLNWNYSTANGALADNVTELIKLILKADTRKLFGSTYHLPYNFNDLDLEGQVVELAKILVPKLVKALVLPEDVDSVEAVVAYSVREFIAEIMPDTTGWDAALAAASTDDDYLDIALSMGTSIGIYYLTNLIGLGTTTDGANNTTTSNWLSNLDYGTKTWQQKFDYIVDWVVTTYLPNLSKNAGFSTSGEDGLASLSAILSTLAPSLLKVLGMTSDSYALDLSVVYNHLRSALDGDFSGLATALLRKSSGTSANVKAIQAIGTFITELFGGLGLSNSSRFSTLEGLFTTAYASSTPIMALIGDYGTSANLANIVKYLVPALGEVSDYWFFDVLSFLLMLLGSESPLTNNGVEVAGVENAYTGSTTATIDVSFIMNTTGIREYFNDGNYGTGTGYMDGNYYVQLVNIVVKDASGNVKGTTTLNETLNVNEKVYRTVNVTGIEETPQVYTLEYNYKIQTPSETSFADSDTLTIEKNFICSSLLNDSLSYTTVTLDSPLSSHTSDKTSESINHDDSTKTSKDTVTSYLHGNWTVGWTNAYVSEVESLAKIEETQIFLHDNSIEHLDNGNESGNNVDYISEVGSAMHTKSMFYVDGIGYATANDDGSISLTEHSTTNFQIYENGTQIDATTLWFKWNVMNTALQSGAATSAPIGTAHDTRTYAQLWISEKTTSTLRSNYTADYTVYKANVNLSMQGDYGDLAQKSNKALWEGSQTLTVANGLTINPYVVLYNSYDLLAILNANMGLKKENYPEAVSAWEEYEEALAEANLQMYGKWNAATFESDHTLSTSGLNIPKDPETGLACEGYDGSTVSSFKYAGDRLLAAVAALADYYVDVEDTESDAEVKIADPSDPTSPYYHIWAALEAQKNEAKNGDLQNHNFLLYTWFRYNDLYQEINNAINALSVPNTEAQNSLVGVDSNNGTIENVLAEIESSNAALAAVVEAMVEAPTDEAQQAAQDAYTAFEEGYADLTAAYDAVKLATEATTMTIYGTDNSTVSADRSSYARLLPKYTSTQKYYLNDAITNYGNEVASDYSEGSYAVYAARLSEAKTVAADSSATQYQIFSARYELLVAYKALIAAGEEINVTTNGDSGTEEDGLKALYAQANEILADMSKEAVVDVNGDGNIDADDTALAYEYLVRATGIEVTAENEWGDESTYYIGGEYTAAYALSQDGLLLEIKKQDWINEITVRVADAIANFVVSYLAPILSGLAGSTGFVDVDNKYVYGIDIGGILSDFFDVANGTFTLVANANDCDNGTGAILNVVDSNNEVVDTYTVVIFGDTNGDAAVDNLDYVEVKDSSQGVALASDAAEFAGDVNGDGAVDNIDYVLVKDATQGLTLPVNPYVDAE